MGVLRGVLACRDSISQRVHGLVGMGGGATRLPKAGEATSAKSVEGRMAARESEGSSSTPSIEDLERVERG